MPRKGRLWFSPFKDKILEILKQVNGHKYTYLQAQAVIKEKYGETYTTRALSYYRNTLIAPEDRYPNKLVKGALEKKHAHIDIIEEKVKLFQEQGERIVQERRLEKLSGKLIPTLTRDIELQDQLLNSIKKDYIELGLLKPVAQVFDNQINVQQNFGVDFKSQFNQMVSEVTAELEVEHRGKVLTVEKTDDSVIENEE